jgi:succinate dehydrogenase / fumarate reductase cytochrome b subunit
MNFVGVFFRSSIGRKIIMAVTGLILVGFVIGHLVGNLQIFQEPDHINGYGQFLHSLGPLLWIARLAIIASVVLHLWAATVLTLENSRARGAEPYGFKHTIQATLASRAMRATGYIVLAFLLYHLAHFTWGLAQTGTYKENLPHYTMIGDYRVAGFVVVKAGTTEVLDVYNMVILGFQNPLVSL